MKNLLLASLAGFALASGSALAADMPAKAVPAPAPVYSWTGCYIDGGGGYGLWNQDHSTTSFGITTVTTTDGGRGWLGRLGAGCDYQIAPKWVIGLLGDYDFMSLKGNNTPNLVLAGIPETATEKQNSAWYVGGRIGYLITPTILTYFDGGYTSTRFTQSAELATSTGIANGFQWPNFTTHGWFLGGGTETPLATFLPTLPSGLFWRSAYRYASYGNRDISEFAVATGLADGNVEHVKSYTQTVTTSLVWRFNWTGQ